jgi:hypothetical protein
MAEREKRRLVVVEDGLLTTMANSPQYVSLFPFLAALQGKKKPGGCGSCSKDAQNRVQVYNAAKAAIAGMAVENKRKLKELLNAKEVRVRFTEGRKVTEKTF